MPQKLIEIAQGKPLWARIPEKRPRWRRAARFKVFAAGLLLASLFQATGLFVPARALAEGEETPFRVVTILTRDDQGKPLAFPARIVYAPGMEEAYLIDSNKKRIIVYDRNYVPVASIGKGRGVYLPRSVFVDAQGRLYIIQGALRGKPQKVTILNAAFLPEKEIPLNDIAGITGFVPVRIAVSAKGRIYITGKGAGGGAVLVLDKEGKFLHWLGPRENAGATNGREEGAKEAAAQGAAMPADAAKKEEEPAIREEVLSLPAELLPKAKKAAIIEQPKEQVPIVIDDVMIDSQGRIYLVGESAGRIYVYDRNEKFLFAFGRKGGSSGSLSRPQGIAFDEKNQAIYVADYMRHTILVYNSAGKYMFEFGGRGSGPGWFNFPTSVAVGDNEDVLVTDPFNKRVQVLHITFATSPSRYGGGEQDEPHQEKEKITPGLE